MKPFGIEGELINFPFGDLSESIYDEDGIEIILKGRLLSAGFTEKEQETRAKEAALLWIAAWNLRQGWNTSIDFNRSWSVDALGARNVSMSVGGETRAKSRETVTITRQVNIPGKATIITQKIIDSASFENDKEIVQKAEKYEELKEALLYYHNEVAPKDRPLYGIFKSIESLTKKIGKDGRKKLGKLAGEDLKYVDDVMQTANSTRHSNSESKAVLDEKECHRRATLLIKAYADSLT